MGNVQKKQRKTNVSYKKHPNKGKCGIISPVLFIQLKEEAEDGSSTKGVSAYK